MRGFIRSLPYLVAFFLLGVGIWLRGYRRPWDDIPVGDRFYDQTGASELTADQLEQARLDGTPLPHAGLATLGPPIGNIAPEIEGKDYYGKFFKLSDYRGRIVVLDCWVDS